jgi:AraC family transcriptional regulator, regulatory protein of adaptative response / methylphosphotriester-DNA alkyltransferase methyltransferase
VPGPSQPRPAACPALRLFHPYAPVPRTPAMTIRDGTVARRRALFDEAAEIIEREYAQPIELDDVARRLATSRRQLQRAFAEAGATSFRTHVAKVRMQRALDLLREGNLPVRDVASSVGYRQPAQFAKTFRRHHGAPPSSFRGARRGAPDGNAVLRSV